MNLIRFHRLWKRALAAPLPADRVLGPWEGSWRSEPSDHTGRLRCVVLEVDENPGRMHAAFHAVFWKVFRMTYEPQLDFRPADDGGEIRGSWVLPPPFGGEFHYQGTVTPEEFRATYRAPGDHGVFEMRRPAGALRTSG